jgi:serine protease AprX
VQELQRQGFRMHPAAGFNFYGMSPHVMTVGAIDNNGTPRDFSDDKAAPFSSLGYNEFGIRIAADGVNVGGDPYKNGTSFAAPQVSAAVDRLLRANPNLTFQQITSILQSTAYDNPSISNQVEGAGLLDADAAAREAQQQATRPRRRRRAA